METGRVTQGEDDGAIDVRGHLLDDFFGEGFWFRGGADQDMGFHFADYGEEV